MGRPYGAGMLPITGLVAERKAINAVVGGDKLEFLEKKNVKYIPRVSNKFMMETGKPGAEMARALAPPFFSLYLEGHAEADLNGATAAEFCTLRRGDATEVGRVDSQSRDAEVGVIQEVGEGTFYLKVFGFAEEETLLNL